MDFSFSLCITFYLFLSKGEAFFMKHDIYCTFANGNIKNKVYHKQINYL